MSATGAVAGFSGPGVMTGLATVGGVVGGGAVTGLAALGAVPGAIGTIAARAILKDDPNLPEEERAARKVGRTASVAGAATGTAGVLTAVYACGTVGLSGAGITSGLAGVGAAVGGGMVAGTSIVVAAPAVAALAIGYLFYRLFR